MIKQSPARTEADAWILEVASQAGGFIISRDTFRDRIEKYPGVRGRVVSFMALRRRRDASTRSIPLSNSSKKTAKKSAPGKRGHDRNRVACFLF